MDRLLKVLSVPYVFFIALAHYTLTLSKVFHFINVHYTDCGYKETT